MGSTDGSSLTDPEVETVRIREVREPAGLLVHESIPERFESARVEAIDSRQIGHIHGDVRNHFLSSPGYSRRA
jgi:hypothetical protein